MHVKFHAQLGSTEFLSLDKGIRPRDFVEIMEIPGFAGKIKPDEEWVQICGYQRREQLEAYFPF
jgi:hypothetical protein